MNTKSFSPMARCAIVTAAALVWVVSVQSASAQRYSFNGLGYADANWVAGSNLVANPYHANPNTISNVLRGLPDGSYFIPWDPGYREFVMYGRTNFYSQTTGWTDPGASFGIFDSGFLYLPEPVQMSFVGEISGEHCYKYERGYYIGTISPEELCWEGPGGSIWPEYPDGSWIATWNATSQQWDPILTYYSGVGWTDWSGRKPLRIAPTEAFQIYVPQSLMVRTWKATGGQRALIPVHLAPSWLRLGTHWNLQIPTNATQGAGVSSTNWSVVRSTNLGSPMWEVVQTGATATSAVTSITVSTGTNDAAFYRLLPFLPSSYPHMLNGRRSGTRFSFEFYAPEAGNYQVQRTTNSPSARTNQWQTIQTIAATAGTVVVVTDMNATAAAGYYRMSY